MDYYYPEPDTKKLRAPDNSAIDGKYGVVAFLFSYGAGSGHFTLWERNVALHDAYFDRGEKNFLWACMEITYVRRIESNGVYTYVLRHAPKT